MESDGNANMLFVNAGTDRVGIGTNSPSEALHCTGGAMFDGHINIADTKVLCLEQDQDAKIFSDDSWYSIFSN